MNFNPCPFCGKKDLDVTSKQWFTELMEKNGRACISAHCKNCKLDMYEHTDVATYEEKVDLLIDKWNRRAKV